MVDVTKECYQRNGRSLRVVADNILVHIGQTAGGTSGWGRVSINMFAGATGNNRRRTGPEVGRGCSGGRQRVAPSQPRATIREPKSGGGGGCDRMGLVNSPSVQTQVVDSCAKTTQHIAPCIVWHALVDETPLPSCNRQMADAKPGFALRAKAARATEAQATCAFHLC